MLRYFLTVIAIGLAFYQVHAQAFPTDTIMRNGDRSNRVNLVYLPDGYTASEFPLFKTNTIAVNSAVFNTVPFSIYKNFFNSFLINVPSNASGAKHPATASDESYIGSSPTQPITDPDNFFKSTFDYAGIHRLLVAPDYAAIDNVLINNLPDYDQAVIVANTPYYGGSGGVFSTISTHSLSSEIAIHELGHSFGDLADEYWAGSIYAMEKPNMTADNNAATVKWKSWLGINNTSIYPYGTSGDQAIWFKPSTTCKMQALGYPFCSVCTQKLVDNIHMLVSMIDDYSPANTSVTLTAYDSIPVSVSIIQTTANTVFVNWYINDTLYTKGSAAIKIPYAKMLTGANTIKAEVVDNTILSKTYLPGSGYINAITWNVNKPSILPITLKNFSGQVKDHKGILHWQIAQDISPDRFELMKSADGNKFSLLAKVDAQQNTAGYSYTDPNLLPCSFYQLKIYEENGSYTYSPVVKLQNAFDSYSYKIYQDAQHHNYRLTTFFENVENVSCTIADASGKILAKKDFGKVNEQLSYNFDLAKYPAGIYFLKLNISNAAYTAQLVAN